MIFILLRAEFRFKALYAEQIISENLMLAKYDSRFQIT